MKWRNQRLDENKKKGEVSDRSAKNLSHVGQAAYEALRKKHYWYHHRLWNVTSGKVVGELHQTPKTGWKSTQDPPEGHDDWFPKQMGDIIARTEIWCDILTLGPPDGLFLEEMKKAFAVIWERSQHSKQPIIIRVMFGHIVGLPVNCDRVVTSLTEGLPSSANVRLYVAAWRKGPSWNHAKIIAVDGRYLHTGGHNMWDYHYLKGNPVHDLSLELTGNVTHDGHLYSNDQWDYIKLQKSTVGSKLADKYPNSIFLPAKTRVSLSVYPKSRKTPKYPPKYERSLVPRQPQLEGAVPILSIGRFGSLMRRKRPSDDAIVAMLNSAKTSLHLALQDLGPFCIPNTKITLPGCVWPTKYMRAMAKGMVERNVQVEIALSNPQSIPADLPWTEAIYGNGWTCVDVAAEIIKVVKDLYPKTTDEELRKILRENLKVCFIRERIGKDGCSWENGKTMGMHAKHFIVDDICCYFGSQNLYICDLAEWGVVIDDEAETKRLMEEYWNPLWESSFLGVDCNVDEVMKGLDIDRSGEDPNALSPATKKHMEDAARQQAMASGAGQNQFYDVSGNLEPPDLRSSVINH